MSRAWEGSINCSAVFWAVGLIPLLASVNPVHQTFITRPLGVRHCSRHREPSCHQQRFIEHALGARAGEGRQALEAAAGSGPGLARKGLQSGGLDGEAGAAWRREHQLRPQEKRRPRQRREKRASRQKGPHLRRPRGRERPGTQSPRLSAWLNPWPHQAPKTPAMPPQLHLGPPERDISATYTWRDWTGVSLLLAPAAPSMTNPRGEGQKARRAQEGCARQHASPGREGRLPGGGGT